MTIEISLTGAVTIDRNGDREAGRCRLRGVQQGVAFAMLVLERDGGVGRDALAEALWPDGLPATWPTALRNVVSRLRAALTGVLGDGEDPVAVHAGRYRLRLPRGAVIDIESAASAVATAEEALHAGDPARARRSARAAIELLQEPFLPGSDGRWVTARRGYIAELYLSGLEVVSRAHSAVGDHVAALVAAKEAVARAPLRESAHRCVIGALAASGNRAEALRTYQLLRTMLAEELGIDPAPETEAAYLDLLVRQPSASGPVIDRVRDAGGTGGTGADGATGLPVLLAAWAAATEGRLQAVVVAEAAGAGGSDLVAEAARRVVADAGSVLFGGGDAAAPAPFQPLVEALDGLLAARAAELVPPDLGAAAQLRRVFPSLRGNRSAAGCDDDRLFGEAVADVLLAATADRPMMLVLDDLEGEGERLFRWLPSLVGRAAPARLLLVALTRDDASGGQAARLAEVLAAVAPRVWSLPLVAPLAPVAPPPPLAPLAPAPTRPASGRLPIYSTSFVDRHAESERTLAALRAGRLVTLIGEAGVGKSRLAIEAAQQAPIAHYPDGVRFCDVSALTDGSSLVEHFATAVGVVPAPGVGQRRQLAAWLAPQELLLVVDNCETLARPVSELVDELMADAADLRILATSRAALRARDEQVVRVQPLGWPRRDAADCAGGADCTGGADCAAGAVRVEAPPAVQLLVERATTAGAVVHEDDPALDEITRRLDDMPLAIELVAPRLASLPASVVAARLHRTVDLLDEPRGTTRNASDASQAALRATIDWSFTLLSPPAQRLFAGVSVFRGGWTIETATPVAHALDIDPESVALLMTELAEQSMIRLDTSATATPRYDTLATLQAYGAEQLVRSGCAAAAAERHAAQFIDLAERTVAHRRGPTEASWASQVFVDLDNLRVAYRWALDAGRPHDALRLVAALGYDVVMREWFEIGRWASELAARDDVADDPLRSVALALASNVAIVENRFDDAARLSTASLESERRTGAPPCWMSRYTMGWLAAMGHAEGDWREHLQAMSDIGRETGEPLAIALADFVRVRLRVFGGRPERARVAADRLLKLGTELSNPTILAMGLLAHGMSRADAQPDVAATDFHHAFQVASSAHNPLMAQHALRNRQQLDVRTADPTATLLSLSTIARRFEHWGNFHEQVNTVLTMLDPLVASGALVESARICGALSESPWAQTAVYQQIDRTLAERLPDHEYSAARRAGALVPLTDLVAYVLPLVDEIARRGAPATAD